MRLWVICLLSLTCLSVTVCAAGRTKIQDGQDLASDEDDKEPSLAEKMKAKAKAKLDKTNADDEENDDDQKLRKGKKSKSRKDPIDEEEEEEPISYPICEKPPKPEKPSKKDDDDKKDEKKGGKEDKDPKGKKKEEKKFDDEEDYDEDDDACFCEMNDVTCDHVIFQDGSSMNTLLLEIADKDFVPYTFRSQDNEFPVLGKGQIIPTMIKTVAEVDLSRSRVKKIEPGAFSDFKNLTVLKLAENNLLNLDPNAFEGEPEKKLHRLHLNQNNLTSLKPGVFSKLKALKTLVLDYNRVKVTKELFEGLDSLEELSLDYCHLSDSMEVDVFDNLPKLKTLSMRGNRFTEVPRAIQSLTNLENLDLSETRISELHEYTFKKDQSLKVLYMTKAKYLWSVDECAFCDLPKLEEVYLSNSTGLYNINKNAFGNVKGGRPKQMKKLDLSYCNISTLAEVILPWEKDIDLVITGNPLNCSCDTAWLLEGEIYTFENQNLMPKCKTPSKVRGKPLPTVKQTEVCSVIRKKAQGGRFLQAFLLLLLASLICFTFYYLATSGRLMNLLRPKAGVNLRYSNLSPNDEQPLEGDFQPRPQDV